jgi:hypothetical protein
MILKINKIKVSTDSPSGSPERDPDGLGIGHRK